MHELGVLHQIVKTVNRIAEEKVIPSVKHIVIEVGEASGFVPQYLSRLYPIAADAYERLRGTELKISMVRGDRLLIKEIGY